jgi:hypothetical protein
MTSAPPTDSVAGPNQPAPVAFMPPFPDDAMLRRGILGKEAKMMPELHGETREVGARKLCFLYGVMLTSYLHLVLQPRYPLLGLRKPWPRLRRNMPTLTVQRLIIDLHQQPRICGISTWTRTSNFSHTWTKTSIEWSTWQWGGCDDCALASNIVEGLGFTSLFGANTPRDQLLVNISTVWTVTRYTSGFPLSLLTTISRKSRKLFINLF